MSEGHDEGEVYDQAYEVGFQDGREAAKKVQDVPIETQVGEWTAAGGKPANLIVMGDTVVAQVDLGNPDSPVYRDVSPPPEVKPAAQSPVRILEDDPSLCVTCGNVLLCECDRRPVVKLFVSDTRYHKTDYISRDTQFWVNLVFPSGYSTRDLTLWNSEGEAFARARIIAAKETAFRFVLDESASVPS